MKNLKLLSLIFLATVFGSQAMDSFDRSKVDEIPFNYSTKPRKRREVKRPTLEQAETQATIVIPEESNLVSSLSPTVLFLASISDSDSDSDEIPFNYSTEPRNRRKVKQPTLKQVGTQDTIKIDPETGLEKLQTAPTICVNGTRISANFSCAKSCEVENSKNYKNFESKSFEIK